MSIILSFTIKHKAPGEIQMERRYDHLYKRLYGIGAAVVFVLLLFPAFRLLPTGAQAPTTPDAGREQELSARVQTFFTALSRGNSAPAFEELLRQSPLNAAAAGTELARMRNKVEEFKTQFGDILRWDKHDVKQIGEDIIVMRYILKYDQYPVIWTFAFYRKPSTASSLGNSNVWTLVEVHFDTNLGSL
jgi:hypothetical protein